MAMRSLCFLVNVGFSVPNNNWYKLLYSGINCCITFILGINFSITVIQRIYVTGIYFTGIDVNSITSGIKFVVAGGSLYNWHKDKLF